MTNYLHQRVQDFRKKLQLNKIDGFLILSEANRRYLSGYTGQDSGIEESAGALFIFQETLVIATDSRFELQASREAKDAEIICYKTGVHEVIATLLESCPCKKIGFESNRISYSNYCKIKESINTNNIKTELAPADFMIDNLRVVKTHDEVAAIRKALAIAEASYLKTLKSVVPGISESELAWTLEKNMREMGAQGLSFPSIVASGPNSALPHAVPGIRKIQKGEPLLFDWGAVVDGYCSDTSRTVWVGPPDDTFEKLFTVLFDAQRMAIDAIKPGANTKVVDSIARDHIAKAGYGKKFGHGLGHGVGLEIHEPPRLSPLKETQLEAGMVVTVEPGIYLPDWGGLRLENMVLVTDSGAEVLNTLSYDNHILDL